MAEGRRTCGRRVASALAEAGRLAGEADALLRRIEFTLVGSYLERRGLRAGHRVRVAPGLVLPGTVALVVGPDGVLAAGVARYDERGRLSVWSDWHGPQIALCHCDDSRPVGPLERVVAIDLLAPGSALAQAVA